MDSRAELLGRLARHATKMAGLVDYEEAADCAARALVEFLPMTSVVQARLAADGEITVGAHIGPLACTLAQVPFERLLELPGLRTPGAVWQAHPSADSDPESIEGIFAASEVRSVAIAGYVGMGSLRGIIVLASSEVVTLDDEDQLMFELLSSQAVGVLRATMIVPNLRRSARTDALTGLGHHRAFSEALATRGQRGRHALILVDVDHFKLCNDHRGHREGDGVLKSVASALSGVLRESDAVFRIGGDEFAALVEVASNDDALEMGRRMRRAVLGADAGVSVSIGIAVGHHGEGDGDLRDRADAALYRVKADGRDGVALDDSPPGAGSYDVAA